MDASTRHASGISQYGGKFVAQMRADEAAFALASAAVTRCAYCAWSHEGTVATGQAAFRKHWRKEHH